MISHKKLNKHLIYGCLCEKVITTPSRYKLNLASFNLYLAMELNYHLLERQLTVNNCWQLSVQSSVLALISGSESILYSFRIYMYLVWWYCVIDENFSWEKGFCVSSWFLPRINICERYWQGDDDGIINYLSQKDSNNLFSISDLTDLIKARPRIYNQ